MFKKPFDPSTLPNALCECGNPIFVRGVLRKEMPPPIVVQNPPQQYAQIDLLYCGKCGKIAPEYDKTFAAFMGQQLFPTSNPEGEMPKE